jgi:mRNA interferase RelE/StbE
MWRVRHTRTFYKELASLPAEIRTRIEKVAFGEEIKKAPFLKGKVQKLEGYREYYKIRFGSYRVGLRIDFENKVVEFQRVLHRKDIYRKFPWSK